MPNTPDGTRKTKSKYLTTAQLLTRSATYDHTAEKNNCHKKPKPNSLVAKFNIQNENFLPGSTQKVHNSN